MTSEADSGNPSVSFIDHTIVVTGAAGKLGSVICHGLLTAGANVVAVDIKEDALKDLAGHSPNQDGRLLTLAISASRGSSIVDETISRFGAIHGIVNSTLAPIPWGGFENTTDDNFRGCLEDNVLGPLNLIRAAWPRFREQKFGRVVNFTSDSIVGFPGASMYTLSKGALLGVNATLAMEGAPHNITVNCVSPIAYQDQMERHIIGFSDKVQTAFKTLYTPAANVLPILALLSRKNKATGKVFCTAGGSVGRTTIAYIPGFSGLKTVDSCLTSIDALSDDGRKEYFEPKNQAEFTEWQAGYVL